jgi:tetratricopeptide (TPR) repeat protein
MNAPPEIDALFRQALSIHQRGSVSHAQTMYEQILAHHPAHFDCCHLLGVAHMQTGSPERAADLISRALTINPESADAHFNLGHALRALGRTDEALASLDRAIGLRPGFAEYHLERGIMLQAAGKLPEALACFEEASRLDPAFPDAHRRRGETLLKLNRLDDALTSSEWAIKLAPRSAEAHSLKGRVLGKLQRPEEALASLDTAIALNPKLAMAYRQRGRILGTLKRLEEAVASYDKSVQLDPAHAESFIYRAAILWELSRYEEALASCNRAIALKPEFAEAHTQKGYALGGLNRVEDALESFDRAMRFMKVDGPARLGRAWLHARCERWELAQQDYEEVLKQDNGNESAWLGLALLPEGYLTAERASEILDCRASSLKADGLATQLFLKAKLLRHLQRHHESFETLRQANDLRLSEVSQPTEWRGHFDRILKSAQSWSPNPIEGQALVGGARLIVVLGPSRAGKSTLESLLCRDAAFKCGFEGSSANSSKRSLREIAADRDSQPSGEVQRRVFEALLLLSPEEVYAGGYEAMTITNPFLLSAAHLIFDLYPKSYFVFLQRDTVDNAAEIYARDYKNKYPFTYSPSGALDYVEMYQNTSSALCRKMGDRALSVTYEDLLASPDIVLTSIYEMLGLEPPVNPSSASAARDTRSGYREFFVALCAEQGVALKAS